MRCGTTPTHVFKHKLNKSIIKKARIIYAQDGKKILVKENEDCTIEDGRIKTKLTQEETLAITPEKPVEIQVRVLTESGDCPTSAIKTVGAARCLDDEVLA